jgi:hypothetical protein
MKDNVSRDFDGFIRVYLPPQEYGKCFILVCHVFVYICEHLWRPNGWMGFFHIRYLFKSLSIISRFRLNMDVLVIKWGGGGIGWAPKDKMFFFSETTLLILIKF